MRTGWVLLLLLYWAPALYALDVQVGRSFKISAVSRPEGKVVLPTQRGKYQNIRILNRDTYEFVASCGQPCVQPFEGAVPAVVQVRPAQSRKGMWIVAVDFNKAWQVTFLVFQKGGDFAIKSPEHFVFLDSGLASRTQELILQAVKQELE